MPYRLTLIMDFPKEPSPKARADMVARLQELRDAIDYLNPKIVQENLVKTGD